MRDRSIAVKILVAVLLCASVVVGGAAAVDATSQAPAQLSFTGDTGSGTVFTATAGLNTTNTSEQPSGENETTPQNDSDLEGQENTTDEQTVANTTESENNTTTTQTTESNTSTQPSQTEPQNTTTAEATTKASSASAIGTRLQQQLAETETQQSSGPATADTAGTATPPETTIEFYIKPNRSTAAAAAIEARGGTVSHSFDRLIRADVPIPAVERIVANDTVRFARKPAKPVPTEVESEGVGLTNADELHSSGIKGDGVTVAVFDTKFNPDNPEISDQVVAQWGDSSGYSSETDLHGTASAEVVADMAPEANLILVPMYADDFDIYDALDKVGSTDRDIDVITMSLGYTPNEPLDGSDPLSQSISDTIQKESISWSNSAGNDAVNHWNGTYEDDGSEYMEFSPSIGSEFEFEGADEPVYVNWNAWDESDQNQEGYIVEIVDENGDVVESFNKSLPYVRIPGDLINNGYAMKIKKTSASKNHRFDILAWDQHRLKYTTPESSISRPATSPNVITVAAVDTDNNLASYSSRGPTRDGRQGIDVAATTAVSNSVYNDLPGYGSYTGTSAAAPHVGGALALLNQDAPDAPPGAIRNALESSATGISDRSVSQPSNTKIGHGYIDVQAAANVLDGELDLPGEGTEANPYEISTVTELQRITNARRAHYELTNDIDASATEGWNNSKGFDPIGTLQGSNWPFTGSFDGNGHTITDLSINRSAESDVGLFGFVADGAEISNVSMHDVNVSGGDNVGAMVGVQGSDVKISAVTVINGNVTGSENSGGIVGDQIFLFRSSRLVLVCFLKSAIW